MSPNPLVIGHRGLGQTPAHGENLASSLTGGWKQGLRVVECDIRKTADGTWLVHHDATRERTHGPRIAVSDLDWQTAPPWDREPPPTLPELLSEVRRGRGLVIELKPDPSHDMETLTQLGEVLAGAPSPEELMLISFEPGLLLHMRRILPWIPLGMLEASPSAHPHPGLEAVEADAWWPPVAAFEAKMVAEVQRTGRMVVAWTVRTDEACRAMEAAGVDGFGSDDPLQHASLLRGEPPTR
ncbi:MAG: glycerophosphodiester phosphodiesterase [Candidatus Sericytochromatia bacterium]|nr:glycerophosphodiester phosphodiesterase [Candidatus Sericytochromatia bacterium]